MENFVKTPSKEEVRKYMQQRFTAGSPIPPMQQIRRELGWELKSPARGNPGAKQG